MRSIRGQRTALQRRNITDEMRGAQKIERVSDELSRYTSVVPLCFFGFVIVNRYFFNFSFVSFIVSLI